MIWSKIGAFLLRDFKTQASYRLAFIMNIFGIFISVAMFFFISKLIGNGMNDYLKPYGGNYFAFALIGIALTGFMGTGMSVFSSTISSAQAQGTLEAMLVTPTKLSQIILLSSIWSFIFTTFNVAVYLIFGVLVFGLELGQANIWPAIVVLFFTILMFCAIGIISASFVMVLKRGDPVSWLFGSVSGILGGTLFPIQVLPVWLQKASYVFPIFYSLRATRLALLKGYSFTQLAPDILTLVIFTSVILPLSIISFKYAVRQAKIDGSLATY